MQTISQPDTWDFNSMLTALRSWEAPVGSKIVFEVLRSRYLWHIDMTVHGKEQLHTELGDLPALRLDAVAYKLTRDGKKLGDNRRSPLVAVG